MWEVAIVGGGPAGLSAALVLGRARRNVLLLDNGAPRNRFSHALHGFLTRDGTDPAEFLALARAELARYSTVAIRAADVVDARRVEGGFQLATASGESVQARKLLLATGVEDRLPPVPGLLELYGQGVFHCPYCDGWEVRDGRIGVLGFGTPGKELAFELTGWSRHVVFFSNGERVNPRNRAQLERGQIEVREEPLRQLTRNGERRVRVHLDGKTRDCDALFLAPQSTQHSTLPQRLGCAFTKNGAVATRDFGKHPRSGALRGGGCVKAPP